MRWFRSHRTRGSDLALLALVIQLAVSLVHVHVGRVTPGVSKSASFLDVRAAGRKSAISLSAGDEAPAIADDYCAVCALIHLASTGVAAQPPTLTLPLVFDLLQRGPSVESVTALRRHARVQARAPPLA